MMRHLSIVALALAFVTTGAIADSYPPIMAGADRIAGDVLTGLAQLRGQIAGDQAEISALRARLAAAEAKCPSPPPAAAPASPDAPK